MSEATPSQAKPVDTTLTTAGGEWQFKLKPVLETGVEGDRQYYLVGYRVEIPDLPKGYTVTSMHKEISGKKDLEEIDSDLSGNSWLYARREPGTVAESGDGCIRWEGSHDRKHVSAL